MIVCVQLYNEKSTISSVRYFFADISQKTGGFGVEFKLIDYKQWQTLTSTRCMSSVFSDIVARSFSSIPRILTKRNHSDKNRGRLLLFRTLAKVLPVDEISTTFELLIKSWTFVHTNLSPHCEHNKRHRPAWTQIVDGGYCENSPGANVSCLLMPIIYIFSIFMRNLLTLHNVAVQVVHRSKSLPHLMFFVNDEQWQCLT